MRTSTQNIFSKHLDFCLWCKWCNIFLPCQIKVFSYSDSRRSSGLKLLFWFYFLFIRNHIRSGIAGRTLYPILAFHMKTITIQNIKYICPTVLVGYITTVCSCSWGNFSQMRELPFWQGKVPSFLFAFPSFLLSFCYQRNFHLVVHNLNLALWVKICKKIMQIVICAKP